MIELEFNDLVKIEEFKDYVNDFSLDSIEGDVSKLCHMYDDIFSHVEIKEERLSGKLLKEIIKREKKEQNEDEEGEEDTMSEWLQKKLMDKTFINDL